MANKKKKKNRVSTRNAIETLHNKYYKNNPERMAGLEEARREMRKELLSQKDDSWILFTILVTGIIAIYAMLPYTCGLDFFV